MILKGIPSGDGGCWCLLVTKEAYEYVTGREPEDFDTTKGAKGPYRYRLYPGTLFGLEPGEGGKVFLVCADATPDTPARKR